MHGRFLATFSLFASPLCAQLFVLDAIPGPTSSNPAELVAAADLVYFTITGSGTGPSQLFRFDGTQLTRVPLNHANSSSPRNLLTHGRHLFLSAITPSDGPELVHLDGSGATHVIDVRAGATGSFPEALALHHDQVYFSANVPAQGGRNLYRYDPATRVLRLVYAGSGVACQPTQITSVGDKLYFSGVVPGGARRLHVHTPGTGVTSQLPPTAPPELLTSVGTKLFFRANSSTGNELWVSDGTTNGTFSPRNIHPTGNSAPSDLVAFDGRCYFAATEGTATGRTGRELWSSDGTAMGTTLVHDINVGASSSNPRALTVAGRTLFFVARRSAAVGDEIFSLRAGTTVPTLHDIAPGRASGFGTNPKVGAVGEGLVVAGAQADAQLGREPYFVTDTGFSLLANIAGIGSSDPSHIVATGTHVFFIADDRGTPPSPLSAAGREVFGFPIAFSGWATCSRLGTGCARPGSIPFLRCNSRPALGNRSFTLEIGNLQPGAPAVMMVAAGPVSAGIPCAPQIGQPLFVVSFVTSAAGSLTIPLPIPGNLAPPPGIVLEFQVLGLDTSSPNSLFATTNGLLMVLGR